MSKRTMMRVMAVGFLLVGALRGVPVPADSRRAVTRLHFTEPGGRQLRLREQRGGPGLRQDPSIVGLVVRRRGRQRDQHARQTPGAQLGDGDHAGPGEHEVGDGIAISHRIEKVDDLNVRRPM